MNQYRQSGVLHNVGLYTSPHLRFVRERIQINGELISEEAFADAFFEMWSRFEAAAECEGKPVGVSTKPVYFRYLTLMAFHTFLKEHVDSAIIECGIGGQYDSTNVILTPTVTAITSIGLDHVDMLGTTIAAIAWQKAGIMKSGASAFTVPQPQEALDVLHSRAHERGVELTVVPEHPELRFPGIRLGLEGSFQKMNASLAIEVAAAHLRKLGHKKTKTRPLPPEFVRGLEQVRLGGRCETRHEQNTIWHLDGAHTTESIRATSQWFSECLKNDSVPKGAESLPRILIFNQQTRKAADLLTELFQSLGSGHDPQRALSHVIFCSNKTFKGRGYSADLISMNTNGEIVDSLRVQKALMEAWLALEAAEGIQGRDCAKVSVFGSIEEAIVLAREISGIAVQDLRPGIGEKPHVLITGSVHLVGGAIEVLET